MSNVLGTVNPISEIAKMAHEVGALVCVDGAQSVPHMKTDVRAEGIDFLAFSGHKLYGPTGIGVLYGRRELLDAMDPFLFGGHMIREVFEQSSTWADSPAKFEAGTCPFVEAVALGTAIDYLQKIGLEKIAAYEHQLAAYAQEQLGRVPKLRVLGPSIEHRGAIFSFVIDGIHAHDISDLLDRRGVAVRAGHHCTMPLHDKLGITSSARASFAFYNTLAEVDRLTEAIDSAQHVFKRDKRNQ
jgi:cysteine desulfurase/selenocysteine lyase